MFEEVIRVMLVDDDLATRMGLSLILRKDPALKVVAQATDGQAAIDRLGELSRDGQPLPDVILMDVRMPVMDGITATVRIKDVYPQVRILILTTYDEDSYAYSGLGAGASGFLVKDTRTRDLNRSVRAVYEGNATLSPRITKEIIRRGIPAFVLDDKAKALRAKFSGLTPRELEVAGLIGEEGLTNEEIAERLTIAVSSAKKEVSRVLAKLGAWERVNIAVMWHKAGT